MTTVEEWLLDGAPWVEYRTRTELLGQKSNEPEVINVRKAILAHPQVSDILKELKLWNNRVLKRHNDANQLLHKLTFIADLGIQKEDNGIPQLIEQISLHKSKEGVYQTLVNIPKSYGGTGEDQWAWMLCDAPLLLYALTKLGYNDQGQMNKPLEVLTKFQRDNGWPCVVAPELGKFLGPGRKADPCPYANLIMLKVLLLYPKWRDSDFCKVGAETILTLWAQRKERRPYMFAMGSGFEKLKAPFIWYDILHVTDVLSHFPWINQDPRFLEMVNIVRSKADQHGRFKAESVWRAWKEWEFGQKKVPSRWLTLLINCMLKRIEKT